MPPVPKSRIHVSSGKASYLILFLLLCFYISVFNLLILVMTLPVHGWLMRMLELATVLLWQQHHMLLGDRRLYTRILRLDDLSASEKLEEWANLKNYWILWRWKKLVQPSPGSPNVALREPAVAPLTPTSHHCLSLECFLFLMYHQTRWRGWTKKKFWHTGHPFRENKYFQLLRNLKPLNTQQWNSLTTYHCVIMMSYIHTFI